MTDKTAFTEDGLFRLKTNEGRNKVCSLEQAVSEHVRPGMNLFIAPEGGAAICELLRRFRDTTPDFVLTMVGIFEHAINFVHCGLVKKLITTNCSHLNPTPGLVGIIQDLYKKKMLEIENWTLYSHLQRLMAGALGLGFLPTMSMIDSSMAVENSESFITIDDPFGAKDKIGLVKALNPDLAIVHAWAADCYGNAIGVCISSQASTDHNMFGPKASKNGVILTVEEIVSTEFIRRYSSLVTLPGYLVKAVCRVPFGAHPQGMMSPLPGLFESYAPDYEFVAEHKGACRDTSRINGWIEKWVFDCPSHDKYLDKLGQKRVKSLQHRAGDDYWKEDYQAKVEKASIDDPPNATEIMILAASRG